MYLQQLGVRYHCNRGLYYCWNPIYSFHLLPAVADVRSEANISGHEHEWYGFDPDAPPPPDDGLSTVQVNEVDLNLPDNIISRLSNEINPLGNSSAFAIDIFQRALEFLENLLSTHSSQ